MTARLERTAQRLERAGRRVPGLRAVLLSPVVARPGYWFASACGWIWGAALLLAARPRREGGLLVCDGLPSWAFGRGGTTIGAVYLTTSNTGPDVLAHEAVHRAQWRRYGLVFIVLYVAAGEDAMSNRFEIEAGLERGGYA
ncbi:hypothetical protein [Homoserinibacter sp. YIM 151385]|uniref:hypothetical protein n=1 Tax=Homoserinibacter sp. YIM 151385 TaxID=2985506 RepID=UPI0022F06DE4|nr:hypothetical protein [Homoserinibacter sp. YIM 151385]WBU38260.1 hypothetical protein OF852_01360 [Homoserinibacter sp. YIM 151385]